MDRLLVSFLNSALASPDALETPLSAARWWAAMQGEMRPVPALTGAKPRFDATLLAELRRLRETLDWAARGAPLAVTFSGNAGTDAVLFPIVYAACALLAGPHAPRLKACARDACGMRFLDETKNGSRRWCSLSCMERTRAPRRQAARVRGE